MPSYSLLQQLLAQSNPCKHPHGRSLPAKDIHSSFGEGSFFNTSLYKRPQVFPMYTEIRVSVVFDGSPYQPPEVWKVANRFVEAVSQQVCGPVPRFPGSYGTVAREGCKCPPSYVAYCITHCKIYFYNFLEASRLGRNDTWSDLMWIP